MDTSHLSRHIATVAMLACTASPLSAATVTKNDTATMLSNLTDWSAAPAAADIGSFNATLSVENAAALTLGGDLSIGNLTFGNSLNGPVTITDTAKLTLNNGVAITATAANHNVTFDCPIVVSVAGNSFEANSNLSASITFLRSITSSAKILWRGGNATFAGGGSYPTLGIGSRTGITSTLSLGADNGIAPGATLIVGEANGTARLDLAGFDQSVGALQRGNGTGVIGNSSSEEDSTLTITGSSSYAGIIQDSIGGGTRRVGVTVDGGSFTLTGANTFTGNLAVTSGAFTLADNASLRFAIGETPGDCNKITGAGEVLVSGDFSIDTFSTDYSDLVAGSWKLIDGPELDGLFDSTFRVISGGIAWTQAGNLWTKASGSKTYTFDASTATLTIAPGGYDAWTSGHGLSGDDADFDADPDGDGMSNGLEFVLGGEPNPANANANSAALLPTCSRNPAGDLVFTFHRKDDSESPTKLTFQWSTDLTFPSPAQEVSILSVSSTVDGVAVVVEEDTPDAATDTVTITVPAAKAPGGRLFCRLVAVQNP